MYASFDSAGVSLATSLTDLQPFGRQRNVLDISLAAVGCAGESTRVAGSVPSKLGDAELEYLDAATGIHQTFVNEAGGVRQRVSVPRLPACAAQGGALSLTLRAADAVLRTADTRALLRAPGGQRLRYEQLTAQDANGNALLARFERIGPLLTIRIETHGAPLPIEVSALVWSEQQTLNPDDSVADTTFGVGVGTDGDTIVVSAPGIDALQVFTRASNAWVPGQVLKRSDQSSPAQPGSGGVELSGDTIAFAPGAGIGISIFERTGDVWGEKLPVLLGSNQKDGDAFGDSITLRGSTLLVSASGDDEQGVGAGAVYVFERQAGAWAEAKRLLEEPLGPKDGRAFGQRVALSEKWAAISVTPDGVPAIVVLDRTNGWKEVHRFQSVALDATPGFGSSLALAGDLLVVGDSNATVDELDNAGAAYVFDLSGAASTQKLVADPPSADAFFGIHVAAGNDAVFATALQDVGSAYFFARDQAGWSPPQLFRPADPAPIGDSYGAALAAAGSSVVVGAPTALFEPGIAIVYALDDGSACTTDSDCLRGFCTDGVCCEARCDAPCQACSAALNSSAVDGKCDPIGAGAKPKGLCASDPKKPCGPDGLCDGAGQCRSFAPVQSTCANDKCAGDAVELRQCDGKGVCRKSSHDCGPYACLGGACVAACNDESDCGSNNFCEQGACTAKHDDSTACSSDVECLHGHCADGVCCNSACTGQREFCADPRSVGNCSVVIGAPKGERDACPGNPQEPCSLASCDGVSGDSCQAFPSGKSCAPNDCPVGQSVQVGRCDGGGSCKCELTNHCSDDFLSVLDASGQKITDCGPYRCSQDECLSTCASSDDCGPGINCDPINGRCALPVEKRTSGGCAIAGGSSPMTSDLGLVLLALLLHRRRTAKR